MTATPSNDWANWGRLIVRPTRERLGLSRAQLARKSGVSAYRILRLERGKTRRPKLLTLRALCNALDLPLPGEEGIYLSLDGVPADELRRMLAEALYEFARRRRDAKRFALMIHLPSNATQLRIAAAAVAAERDLAIDVLGLLCPELDLTALASPPEPPTRRRRMPVPPLPLHRRPRHPARPHG
jgi:transcriptional regulator with XRE-family HTH domain